MMEYYLKSGQFPAGSMGPKIEAATRFIRSGGKDVFITSADQLIEAIHGKAGTHITARHESEQDL
jgi:carbamate kinase